MDEANQARSKRWNRRSSDGAAWSWESGSDLFENNDDDGEERRRSSCSTTLRRMVESQQLFSHEPFHWTAEFRDRIAASSRASAVSFGIFALLAFSGQGEDGYIQLFTCTYITFTQNMISKPPQIIFLRHGLATS